MWDTFSKADPEALGAFAIYLVIAITIIAIAGMRVWRTHHREKMEAELKMEMVSRGMSADEIERVIRAKADAPAPNDESITKIIARK